MVLGLCLAFCLAPWPQRTSSAPPAKWACGHGSPTLPLTQHPTGSPQEKGNHCTSAPGVCPACRIQAGEPASRAQHQPLTSFPTLSSSGT